MTRWHVSRFALAYIATRSGQNHMVLIASSAHGLRRLMDRHAGAKP
jgi:hypothetical protein